MDGAGDHPGDQDVVARDVIGLAVTLRLARAEDLAALEWYGLYTPHREIIHATFRSQRDGAAAMLMADIRGFPAGQVWIDFVRKRRLGVATLWAVRVFPPFQRAGLGSALMRAAEGLIVARGVMRAELGVDRDNAPVIRFYERLGYDPAGTERGRFSYRTPDGERVDVPIDQILLRKTLG